MFDDISLILEASRHVPAPDRAGMREVPYAVMTSADKEVEDVHAGAGLRAIQLGVSALTAGDGDEFLFCTLNSLAKSPPVAWNWSLSYDRHPHLTQTY